MPRASLDDLRRADRVLLYGVTGSGKSTAAVAVGERLGLPVHLVDEEIGWLPGWQERPLEEQRAIAGEIVAGERWVLDSSYGKWIDLVMPRTQVVVGLDYPRWLSLGRLLRRTTYRWAMRVEMCNGNVERARQIISRDSIIVWHFRSFTRKRERMRAWVERPDGPPLLLVRRPKELEAVLAALSEDSVSDRPAGPSS